MFNGFLFELRSRGLPVGLHSAIDFYKGLRLGLAKNLDELYDLAALCFVKRVGQMDRFERAFIYYFTGVDLPNVAEGDPNVMHTSQFREWLSRSITNGEIKPVSQNLTPEELMKKFWDTIQEQTEAHHGGNKWVGTGGTSPFGHSGHSKGGVRVHGESKNRSASKVYGIRRYISYSDDLLITDAPIENVLRTLRNLKPHGPADILDLPETIYRSARNAGEIELVFKRELYDRTELILLLDNGGSSMLPFVDISRKLFARIQDRFINCDTYYFHNTIYENVYKDQQRCEPISLRKILAKFNQSMIIIIGDASMNPYELTAPWGSIDHLDASEQNSIYWLKLICKHSDQIVWLNPIPDKYWRNNNNNNWTLQKINEIFQMEDMSMKGLKNAVDYLLSKHN